MEEMNGTEQEEEGEGEKEKEAGEEEEEEEEKEENGWRVMWWAEQWYRKRSVLKSERIRLRDGIGDGRGVVRVALNEWNGRVDEDFEIKS